MSRHPGSRLPDDAAYWDRLAARSIDAAFSEAAAADDESVARDVAVVRLWWRALSDSAFALAASALLALAGGALLVGERPPSETSGPVALTHSLAPDAPLLLVLAAEDEPSSAETLLRLVALREVER